MSTCINREISCPNCGSVRTTPMWSVIHPDQDPDLRMKALNETLFDWICPSCHYSAQVAYPCLYHDKPGGFMVCISSRGEVPASLNKFITPDMQQVKKRMVNSLTELKEKVLLLENGFNDVAMEIVKLAIADVVQKKWEVKPVRLYFRAMSQNSLDFAVFRPDKPEPIYQGTRPAVYDQAVGVLASLEFHEGAGFLKTDEKLARELLNAYSQ